MPSNSAVGATKRKRATDTRESSPQAAIPGLLDDIVVTHILRSEYFDDPADLARLPAVSHAMRDAVAAMVIGFAELGMFKRGEAPGTGRSPVASSIPL